jgi:hypothetical protein
MAVRQELDVLQFDEAELDEIQGAIDTLSPEAKEKIIGAMAVIDTVVTGIMTDDWVKDRNRELLANRRFLAQAERRGYIHEDDRYSPLRERMRETASQQFDCGTSEETPPAHMLLINLSVLARTIAKS